MKKLFLSIVALFAAFVLNAADGESLPFGSDNSLNPMITAMPSLSITPDARAGGMGDVGVATNPDLNSQHWNPAKYAFMESRGGITASYTPWLSKIVKDINLAYIAGYYKWDDIQGISASFRYFSLGTVQLTDYNGSTYQDVNPNEWALDVAYSRKLHEYVSMAVALRFMYADMNPGRGNTGSTPELYPGMTAAADVAVYYRQPFALPMGDSHLAVGLNISNLGGTISYDQGYTRNYIPANIRLGVSYELPFDNYNRLSFSFDVNKMMVPTRKSRFAVDENGNYLTGQKLTDWYSNLRLKGLFYSFCDAPGYIDENGKQVSSFMEELQEITFGLGLEYSYNRQFFARFGYQHEDAHKGNRRYVTFGAGFHLSIFSLDAGYVLAVSQQNPLDNTFRVTLGFDLAGIKDLVSK